MALNISLTSHKQDNWLKGNLLRITLFLIALSITLCVVYFITQKNNEITVKVKEHQASIQNHNQKIEILEQKISDIRTQFNNHKTEHLSLNNVMLFINLIQNIPVEGSIENIDFLHEEKDLLQITGKISEEHFSELEKYIHQQNLKMNIDHFQVKENSKAEFTLKIEGKE